MRCKLINLRRIHGIMYDFCCQNKKQISEKMRLLRNFEERRKLKNKQISIISNTCIGGVICHDMGIRFNSPTINIYIRPADFVKFCKDLQYYLNLPLVECPFDKNINYPVAKLGDITLFCKHYDNFAEVEHKWTERKNRINWDNLFIIMTDRDFLPPISLNKEITCCEEKVIKDFDCLPFKNKICIVKNQSYTKKYNSCRRLLKGCDKNCVGIITNIISITGKRMYQYVENFNYINYLNEG